LPRPFIFTKAWLASVLMGRLLSPPYMCKRASGATTAFGGGRAGYCEPAAPACSTTLPQRTISDLT
jgi:hypothetical protein